MSSLKILVLGKMPLSYVGGAEISTRYLIDSLIHRGHRVMTITSIRRRSLTGIADMGLRAVTGRAREHMRRSGDHCVVMSLDPIVTFAGQAARFEPDVVVVTGTAPAFAREALSAAAGYPSVLYIRVDAALDALAGAHLDLAITNSEFLAGLVRQRGQDARFLPSVFPRERYEVSTSREKVLFVNPVPKKGLDIALHLARERPDIPFVFSLSWRIRRRERRRLKQATRPLENVEIRPATAEPAELYRDARLVIVPSQLAESWGRVISEAHIVGIPVIASHVGGVPEAVGPGGILVAPKDSKDDWVAALSRIWDDTDVYERFRREAEAFSRRADLDVESVTDRFEDLLVTAIARHASCPDRLAVARPMGGPV